MSVEFSGSELLLLDFGPANSIKSELLLPDFGPISSVKLSVSSLSPRISAALRAELREAVESSRRREVVTVLLGTVGTAVVVVVMAVLLVEVGGSDVCVSDLDSDDNDDNEADGKDDEVDDEAEIEKSVCLTCLQNTYMYIIQLMNKMLVKHKSKMALTLTQKPVEH